MTKKEAMIHTLVRENDELKTEIGRLRQALEQKSCKDTISREAVLKEIPVLWNSNGDKDYCMESLRDFVTELPSVTPTRKAGKWKEYPHEWGDNWQYSDYECSICHNRAHFDTDFCPNCGAEMESEE